MILSAVLGYGALRLHLLLSDGNKFLFPELYLRYKTSFEIF